MEKILKIFLIFMVIITLLSAVKDTFNIPKKNNIKDEVTIQEESIEETEPTTVVELVEKETDFTSNYNKDTKALTLKGKYISNLGSEKGLFLARYSAYEAVKLCEEKFPNEVDNYIIKLYHDTVDEYGNKNNTKVYSLVLYADELSKVNWDNIESDMLADLGEEYINSVIFK